MENDSDSLEKEHLQPPTSDRHQTNAIEVPSAEAYPLAPYERYQITSREIDALVKSNPEVILELIQENQRQQSESQKQRFELEKIKLEYEHQVKVKKEENKLKSEQHKKNIIRLSIAAFCAIFAGALIYSARVNDKNLPNTIITAAISLLAGGSTSVIAFSNRGSAQENDDQQQQNIDELS